VIGCILGPFKRVNIDKIDQLAELRNILDELRHDRGKNHGRVNPLFSQRTINPGMQTRIAIVGKTQRLLAKQTAQAGKPGKVGSELGDVQVYAIPTHGLDISSILRVVNKGPEEHTMPGSQMLEQMIRANLVAFIRRIRQAVYQI
jgi:hypothetical protein